MAASDNVELDGVVVDVGAGGFFRIQVTGDHIVTARLGGKLRQNKIRVVLGDRVKVRVSPYDPTRGIVVYREK